MRKTNRYNMEQLSDAVAMLRKGGLVAVPTETVYGLCANGLDAEAVAHLYEVKGRPEVKPLSLMVHDAALMERYCENVPPQAYTLAKRFWPGPLTMILPRRENVPLQTTGGLETVTSSFFWRVVSRSVEAT